jgi:nucleotide-binding universal stress UspA family protein
MREAKENGIRARYARIVTPLDGSELAERALPHAVSIAAGLDRPLHLIKIVDITPLTMVSPVGLGAEQAAWFAALETLDTEEQAAREYLEGIKRRLAAAGVTVTWEVERGLVIPTLLERIKADDLLCMTTHGRTGLKRWFYGSVAEALMRRSAAPVLLIRAHENGADKREHEER